MFQEFPYSDMHQLNLDWIIKIAKDFLDQYTHLQELIETGETSLTNLTTDGLEQLEDKAETLTNALQAWYDEHSNDISEELASALADIASSLASSLSNITSAKDSAIQQFNIAAQNKAAETIESIPADYSALAADVALLMSVAEQNINIWPLDRTMSFTWQAGDSFTEMAAGYYTISAIVTSDDPNKTNCRIVFYSDNVVVAYGLINRNIRSQTTVFVPVNFDQIRVYSSQTSNSSQGYSATWTDIVMIAGTGNIKEYLPTITNIDYISRNEIGMPVPNLLDVSEMTTLTEANFTVQLLNDNSILLNGTPASSSGKWFVITLPAGTYILSGVAEGASAANYFYRILWADNSYTNIYTDEYEFTLTQTQTFQVYIRWVESAVIDNAIFKPMIRNKYTQNNTFAPYGAAQVYKPLAELINNTPFNWAGKKLNAIGDSIVEHGLFIKPIQQILNLGTVRNYGIGGSSIASRGAETDTDYPPACTRYTTMNDDADIIIIHAGTNDYTSQVPLGDADSTDITTFNGALNVLLSGLRDKYPTALIIVNNILDRIQDNNPSRYPIVCQEYRNAIEAACVRNKIVFYDCFTETGLDFHKAYYTHSVSDDGLHPNETGGAILGRCEAGFINWH